MSDNIALFCKGYITAYSKAGVYHIHDNSMYWRFGIWLGKKLLEVGE